MSSTFSLPVYQGSHQTPANTRKRKRKNSSQHGDDGIDDDVPVQRDQIADSTEYSAIVTPEERSQRRLAGQVLTDLPPAFPFPHAAEATTRSEQRQTWRDADRKLQGNLYHAESRFSSLREAHISTLTSLLHKTIETRDWDRAARALSLLLRTEVRGRFIDLRHGNLWRIAIEILFSGNDGIGTTEARHRFQRTKQFLEHMALQHPWTRNWPNAINIQDFKLTMFGLWIYTCCQASVEAMSKVTDTSDLEEGHGSEHQLSVKRVELAEAENIAREMNAIMRNVPFIDDKEMLRLQAHVALWVADVADTISDLEHGTTGDIRQTSFDQWLEDPVTRSRSPATGGMQDRTVIAQRQAQEIMLKLGNVGRPSKDQGTGDDDDDADLE